MKMKDMGHGDRILTVLGYSLFGVILFVIAAGVIVSLLIPKNQQKQTEKIRTSTGQEQKGPAKLHANSNLKKRSPANKVALRRKKK
ncbi:hypothetical protein F9U64_09640 [Gracilibacillus oryzae]|uniref:Uncharacterized protein n=1 Tax=Gracilibacillus oryzae TaxID=1672701 RepID=A0A7C8KQB7_9BACI|nr:hypothetical protein [Gracilibacillus oryzae]KAB8136762.1 hypothetical protein F9U64_09640 [Gracilibacillus oryzae]